MYNENLKPKILKNITPTKWGIFKCFIKIGIVAIASTYYVGAVNNQIKKNENNTILSSIEEVLKEQYDTIKDPFLKLLNKAEGFQRSFYADNKGYAVGYGYNPTQNSKEYNKSILDFSGVDADTKDIVLKNAEKYKNQNGGRVPEELRQAKFTKEQLEKMAVYSQRSYERSFFKVLNNKLENKNIEEIKKNKVIKAYTELPENKKAVLIHMAYKVGETNLGKYRNFFNNFINYLENPTDKNKESVAKSFTYKYAKNGIMLNDTRVEKLHHDLFMKDMPKKDLVENNKLKNSNSAKKEYLTEKDKFNKAMKEVNDQITFYGALELVAKAITKNYEKFSKEKINNNKIGNNKNTNEEIEYEEEYAEEPSEYYEYLEKDTKSNSGLSKYKY